MTADDDELRRLKAELNATRYDLIMQAPRQFYDALLASGRRLASYEDLFAWRPALAEAATAAAQFDENGYAHCPICDPTKQFTAWRADGLRWHLRGSHRVEACPIVSAAYELHRDQNSATFNAARDREFDEKEQRLKTEPTILLDPADAPVLFEGGRLNGHAMRSAEDLAATQARLAQAGVVIERTGNVVAYRLKAGDDFMALADPRRRAGVRFAVFKRRSKNLWKQIGAFDVRGARDWQPKIQARFQRIIEQTIKAA
jgi:hypothetical protein